MDMLEIQRALTSQGFNPGPVDGIFGRLTSGAIKDFQNRNGLPATGTPDDATVQQILAAAKAIASTGLVWMDEARRLMGTKEVAGKGSNKTIIDWATALGIDYPSDDIPWCGLFVAHCIGATLPGEPLPANPLGARNWQKFGNPTTPAEGAVAGTLFARNSTAAETPPLPCGMPSAASAISTTLSVPKIIGALTWPICAMRKPLPSDAPSARPSTTPHFSRQ